MSYDSNTKPTVKEFATEAHSSTNHFYDNELPYSFHLRMVVKVANDFEALGKILCEAYFDKTKQYNLTWQKIVDACWLHDSIEDARKNYNDIVQLYNYTTYKKELVQDLYVPEIVRAVTNIGRGRTRDERMPDEVYNDIRNTSGATFVKLCDRIANVSYSKMMGSSMFKKYKTENPTFVSKLDGCELQLLQPMVDHLNKLFESNV